VQLLVHLVRSALPARVAKSRGQRLELSSALVRAADVQLNIALTRGDNLLALTSSLLALNVGEGGRNSSVRALLLLALAARVARLRGVTRRYIARANALLPLTTDRKDLAEALSYCGYYWIGEGKLGRARDYLFKSIEASTSIGYQLPLSWSVGQLSMCASLQGRFAEMLERGEACEQHATVGDATHVAAQCTQILALLRLGRFQDARERRARLSAPLGSDSPLTLAIRAATTASYELERGHLSEALALADGAHRALPWVSQVPPVWPEVLTAPIEVYLRAWQMERDAHARASRVSRLARRRIRALRSWARIYPVARPIADYYSAQAARLCEREQQATALFQRARDGARARGLGHYERLSTEALDTPRRPLQSSAI
jgi:tetratricopeptide (TPR) repeat protein